MAENRSDKKKTIEFDEKTYEALVEILNSAKIIQDYLNDQVIQDFSRHLSAIFKLVNSVSGTDLVDIFERGLQDPKLDKALMNPPNTGIVGLLRAMGDEDVQRGMGIMISLLSAIGRASRETDHDK